MTADLSVSLAESRFDRQERITWWDQERLARARVLVVGAGALGNEIVKNLVLVGVGSVVVVDFDHVEMSNLSRCVFFREEDEGRPKAEALAERAGEISGASDVVGLVRDVRSFGTGVGLRADLVLGGLDSREARLFVNRLAWRTGRPWVDGAIEALSGLARVFQPPTSCYECTLTEGDFAALSHRQSCRLLGRDELLEGKVPTTATTSSVVAGLQVQEAVKLLHAEDERAGARAVEGAWVLDGANNDAYVISYPFDEDCFAHQTFDDPVRIDGGDEITFADVVAAAGWDEAVVELGDDHLVSWRCTTCETDVDGRGVVSMLTFEHSACAECGEARLPVTAASVSVPGEHADETLATFAVRTDEVLAVRKGMEERHVWIAQRDADLPESW
jgi:adenylyltransferase/sulfurtransferase